MRMGGADLFQKTWGSVRSHVWHRLQPRTAPTRKAKSSRRVAATPFCRRAYFVIHPAQTSYFPFQTTQETDDNRADRLALAWNWPAHAKKQLVVLVEGRQWMGTSPATHDRSAHDKVQPSRNETSVVFHPSIFGSGNAPAQMRDTRRGMAVVEEGDRSGVMMDGHSGSSSSWSGWLALPCLIARNHVLNANPSTSMTDGAAFLLLILVARLCSGHLNASPPLRLFHITCKATRFYNGLTSHCPL